MSISEITRILTKNRVTPDELFYLLKPESITEFVYEKNYSLRSSYKISENKISDFDVFKTEVAKYYLYHLSFGKSTLDNPGEADFYFNLAEKALSNSYRNAHVAFDTHKQGRNQGLREIYDKICDHFIREHKKKYVNHISNIFLQYDNNLIEKFFEQYFQLYGNYLDKHYGYYLSNIRGFVSHHIDMVMRNR